MPAALASKDEIVDRLFAVFRERGFDGASLTDLSRATGLGKSSLYHYFPRGKEQMVEAALGRAEALIDSAILSVAQSPEPLKVRVSRIIATLEQIYAGGRAPCVLGQRAISGITDTGRQSLRGAFAHWINAIAKLANEGGMSPARAHNFAEDWVAQLQGALILQAATGNRGTFERALHALLDLTKGDAVREEG